MDGNEDEEHVDVREGVALGDCHSVPAGSGWEAGCWTGRVPGADLRHAFSCHCGSAAPAGALAGGADEGAIGTISAGWPDRAGVFLDGVMMMVMERLALPGAPGHSDLAPLE